VWLSLNQKKRSMASAKPRVDSLQADSRWDERSIETGDPIPDDAIKTIRCQKHVDDRRRRRVGSCKRKARPPPVPDKLLTARSLRSRSESPHFKPKGFTLGAP